MDELPELPFEKILSYLSLEEVIKMRAVSRSCLWKIDNYKVKHLIYSRVSTEHILEKPRWVSGAFAQNFIVSTQFESFFKTFGRSILSHLKHLRLYTPDAQAGSRTAFTRTLNSFVQLEELDLIGKWIFCELKRRKLKLKLPMLKSVQFELVHGIEKLTLDAPLLKKVKLNQSRLFLDLVHGESVESLLTDYMSYVKVKSLKNLKTIYLGPRSKIDFPLLFDLEHLKAIHLIGNNDVRELFDLKRRHGRVDLEIYRLGCLLNGPDDPTIHPNFNPYNGAILVYLAARPSKMADQMPFWFILPYEAFEYIAPESHATILNRMTDLSWFIIQRPVQDIDHLLNFVNTFNIASLEVDCDQQALFDRLPDYGGLQKLCLIEPPSDFKFLFRLKNLVYLSLKFSVNTETIRMILEELPLLEFLRFQYPNAPFEIGISIETPKRFEVLSDKKELTTFDLNDVIQFIEQNMSGELEDMEVD